LLKPVAASPAAIYHHHHNVHNVMKTLLLINNSKLKLTVFIVNASSVELLFSLFFLASNYSDIISSYIGNDCERCCVENVIIVSADNTTSVYSAVLSAFCAGFCCGHLTVLHNDRCICMNSARVAVGMRCRGNGDRRLVSASGRALLENSGGSGKAVETSTAESAARSFSSRPLLHVCRLLERRAHRKEFRRKGGRSLD
jgi:hypothetical protein